MQQDLSDTMAWLAGWYAGQCNGDWEHQFGVQIETLDNPGWQVRIDLAGTGLDYAPFAEVSQALDLADAGLGARWYHCAVTAGQFHAACGAFDLDTVLSIFRRWAAAQA